ncbi:hypothetical protein F503_01195 [Ophiostoma piceae UAMH 11346]|uniref:Uncharacterized protein n=1 Tax=Ophiostoma piceae (strain UAMH 11346) TaxID=1262450 RepID=S3C6I4_OPHP1|nr:hypothetical protein F503_01195 [Ophiostoma piceae UAMH 11346]
MDPYLHALWGRARFALEPLDQRKNEDDGAEIDIRFHWLRPGTKRPRDVVEDADNATIAAVCRARVYNSRREGRGAPVVFPLSIQWYQTPLAAMCGAADVDGAEDDDDSDDSDDSDYQDNIDNGKYDYLNEWFANGWLAYDEEIEPLGLDDDSPGALVYDPP